MEAFGTKEDKAFDAHMLRVSQVGPYFWDRFARRMFMSHDRAKRLAYRVMYGVETDPWILNIINTELEDLMVNFERDALMYPSTNLMRALDMHARAPMPTWALTR